MVLTLISALLDKSNKKTCCCYYSDIYFTSYTKHILYKHVLSLARGMGRKDTSAHCSQTQKPTLAKLTFRR